MKYLGITDLLPPWDIRTEVKPTRAFLPGAPELDPAPSFGMEELWFISLADGIDEGGVGDFASREFGSSYFARLAYNYDDRYLV